MKKPLLTVREFERMLRRKSPESSALAIAGAVFWGIVFGVVKAVER